MYYITEEDFYIRSSNLREKILEYKEKIIEYDNNKTDEASWDIDNNRVELSIYIRKMINDSEGCLATDDDELLKLFNQLITISRHILIDDSIIDLSKGNLLEAKNISERRNQIQMIINCYKSFNKDLDYLIRLTDKVLDKKSKQK